MADRQVGCRASRYGRHHAVRMVSFVEGVDGMVRKEVRECAYCNKLFPFVEPSNDTPDALVELRAAALVADEVVTAKKLNLKRLQRVEPVGYGGVMSGVIVHVHDSLRGDLDCDESAGWLARVIAMHVDEGQP